MSEPILGFIRSKDEIKYLILYVAERLIAPVRFEVMQELVMCDPAIDFFDFSECMSYLVRTEHLTCSKDDLYAITRKGVENGRACAGEIPYSVRLTAERLTEAQNQRIQRARQVKSSYKRRANGIFDVKLTFDDDGGDPVWRLALAVPDEEKAKDLTARFQEAPEKLYTQLIGVLFPPKKNEAE